MTDNQNFQDESIEEYSIEDGDFESGIGDLFWKEMEHITCNVSEKTKKELMHLAIENSDFDGMNGSSCNT